MTQLKHHEIIQHKACKIIGRARRVKPLSPEIPKLWDQCFSEGLFEKLMDPDFFCDDLKPETVGVMYDFNEEMEFTYLVGVFLKPDTPTLGYDFVEFPAGRAIITWVQGPESKIYGEAHTLTETKLNDLGLTPDYSGICGIEIYTMDRFVPSKEKGDGSVILDYLIPLK